MNLHKLVRQQVSTVNPSLVATIRKSNGYTTNADFSRTPTYENPRQIRVSVQSLQYNDIAQLDGMNIQGERRAMYISGNWEGDVRPDGRGGDLITLPDKTVWLVVLVLEDWGDRRGWVKVAVTRQMP